jgi:effector-binding domain-containing protein
MPALELHPIDVALEATPLAQLGGLVADTPGAVGAQVPRAFERLYGFVQRHRLHVDGPPMTVYYDTAPSGRTRFAVAVPVVDPRRPIARDGAIQLITRPAMRARQFLHVGPYEGLADTYRQITDWMLEHGDMQRPDDWAQCMPMWEEYLSDPEVVPRSELETRIVLPLPG